VDGAQFDHFARLAAQTATRRAALGLAAALGLGVRRADAARKGKNRCKSGCGPCRVCKKKGKKKTCVTAPDGAACAGGTCRAGRCACTPETCATLGQTCGSASDGCGGALTCGDPCPCVPGTCTSLEKTCGPVADGCGGTLACGICGAGDTPACHNGTCATCAATCPESCTGCLSRPNGSTVCTSTFTAPCETPCTTDADGPAENPVCAAIIVGRTAPVTIDIPELCGTTAPGSCVLAIAC
jgi:hypothetical protein